MRHLSIPLCLLLAAGCGDATGILVEVSSSDLSVPGEVDVLRFEVSSGSGRTLDRTYPIDGAWPHSLTVLPATGRDSDVTITVTALKGGTIVVRRVVRTAFQRGSTRRVQVDLSRDCVGVVCPAGVDCLRGMCVDPPPDSDAGVDGGPDLLDAGPRDGGDGVDAFVPPMDGGSDAGALDGGPDPLDAFVPTDGGTDAFVPPVDAGSVIPVCTSSAGACAGLLVISELTYEGAGPSDEMVEVYNRSTGIVNAGGVTVGYRATTGSVSTRATIPTDTMIPAGGYYLLASSSYTGSVPADPGGGWGTGLSATRGAVLLRAGTAVLDAVGWRVAGNTETVSSEGPPIVAADLGSGQSYERKAIESSTAITMDASGRDEAAGNRLDRDDNAADFVLRAARDPQNSSSPVEP